MAINTPKYLQKNDKVAIICMAGKTTLKTIEAAIEILGKWGLQIIVGDTVGSVNGVFGGSDSLRKSEFQKYLNDPEIKTLLTYIESQGGTAITQTTVSTIRPLSEATPNNVEKGKQLFSGELRFLNGGAPCVSCHNVPDVTMLGGGNLAIDLTNAYTRLNEAGLTNMIQTQPFPVMKQSFINNAITDEEVFDLSAYLKFVDEVNKNAQQTNQPKDLLYSGIGGLFVLLILFTGLWHNRRKQSVNHEIYKRQEDYIKKNS